MKWVALHPEAATELEAAAAYYDDQRAGLGREFRLEFEDALSRLVRNPGLFAFEVKEIRACPLRRFPYTVYFADLQDRIWIVAVAHQRRRPRYWARRRPNTGSSD